MLRKIGTERGGSDGGKTEAGTNQKTAEKKLHEGRRRQKLKKVRRSTFEGSNDLGAIYVGQRLKKQKRKKKKKKKKKRKKKIKRKRKKTKIERKEKAPKGPLFSLSKTTK